MLKALVIGCGNIGAEYDLNNDQVLTHAKAFSRHKNISFSVADINPKKAKAIGDFYHVPYYSKLNEEDLKEFEIISLCVNTGFHFEYLQKLANLKHTPFIICEKPVVASLKEIEMLKKLRINEDSVFVNYIRRFQPGFLLLKKRFEILKHASKLKQVIIKYQKGLLNNGSHAIDLLTFLFGKELEIKDWNLIRKEFDFFKCDPTISGSFVFNHVNIIIIGLPALNYSVFEMEIFFEDYKISIEDDGNTIKYLKRNQGSFREDKKWRQSKVLHNYMIPVLKDALSCFKGRKKTNYASALSVNEQILNLTEI